MDAASAHLARLGATSRRSGSIAAAEARAYCATVLRDAGFTVAERPFEYSKFPGAYATPLAGALVPVFAFGLLVSPHHSRAFAAVLLVAAVLAALVFRYVGGSSMLDLGAFRGRGVNLEAVRGGAQPAVWLVAHIDSKWQPVSMIARVLGVLVSGAGLLTLTALAIVHADGSFALAVFVVTCAGAIPLMLSYVGDRNHGTLDNASGVAAVLEAASLIAPELSVGVLITDAEELALAGARAWARGREPAVALNCDSIDDVGTLTVMHSSPGSGRLRESLERAAASEGERLRIIRLIPGILTDHVALGAAGWTTVTLSRGSIRTLRRIHTTHDTLATMRGTGIAGAARVLATTATEVS